MENGWAIFWVGLFIGTGIGVLATGICAGMKRDSDDKSLDGCEECKRLMCEECRYFKKLENARAEIRGMNEALERERKSNRALGGTVNQQLYHIKELRLELRRYRSTERKLAFNDMVRSLQP